MVDMHACLAAAPYSTLRRVARTHGLVIGHDVRRASVLARLQAAPWARLIDATLDHCRATPAWNVLLFLAASSGRYDLSTLEERFRHSASGPTRPESVGPIAWLTAHGLAFIVGSDIIVPTEVIARLPPGALPTVASDASGPIMPQAPLSDLGVILAASRRERLSCDGRGPTLNGPALDWLVPRCRPSLGAEGVLFLTDLALAAGLLTRTGRVYHASTTIERHPSAGADAQGYEFWHAWLEARSGSRARGARPPCASCPHLRAAVVRRFAARLPAPPIDSAPLLTIVLDDRDAAIIRRDLPCMGTVHCRGDWTAPGVPTPVASLIETALTWLGVCTASSAGVGLSVTIGAWGWRLVHGVPPSPRSAPLVLLDGDADGEDLFVRVPDTLPLATSWFLAAIAEPVPDRSGRWRIEAPLVTAWASDDPDLIRLFATLEALARHVLPPVWRYRLTAAAVLPCVTVSSVTLVEATGALPPEIAWHTVADRTLSPRAVVLAPGRERALHRMMRESGLCVRVEHNAQAAPNPDTGLAGRRRIALAVGLDLLDALAARGLPAPHAAGAARRLGLSETERQTVDLLAGCLRAALDARWEGEEAAQTETLAEEDLAPAPAATPAVSVDTLRAVIAQAIRANTPLRLRYNAPRGAQWRVVEPLRLEQQAYHVYLRAYCRWRRGVRLFRLDRVVACDPLS